MMNNKKRKIAIYTGNRAEYGLQYPIIKAIDSHPDLDYFLLVSGAHLQEEFGKTVDEISNDGFNVYSEVKIEMLEDSVFSTARAIGTGILNLGPILEEISPDFLVVYADRFEGFSAVITGSQMNIPVAHIEGGDITEGGALDDSVRHAMTKLSHIHFTTNEEASERIRRLGEEPWRIFNVGFPVIDLIKAGNFSTPDEIVSQFQIDINKPILLFTQHSITTEIESAAEQIRQSLNALEILAKEGVQVIVTYPNNDAGAKSIILEIEHLKSKNISNIQIYRSLGRYNYHGFLNLCGKITQGVCVGNSSSGIKETPAFGCPTVNIGSRQKGRLRSVNVLDVDYDTSQIIEACKKAIYDKKFRQISKDCENPYGKGNAGKQISNILATIDLNNRLLQKKMTH